MSREWEVELDLLGNSRRADALLLESVELYKYWDVTVWEQRVKKYKKMVELRPNAEYAWLLYGLALVMVDRHIEGIKSIEKAAELKPDDAKVLGRCAFILGLKGLDQEALRFLDRASNLGGEDFLTHLVRGGVLSGLGRFKEAFAILERCLKLNPDHSAVWSAMAECLFGLGKLDEGFEACEKSIELDPRNIVAWDFRGRILAEMGKTSEAFENVEKMMEIEPQYAQGWFHRLLDSITLRNLKDVSRILNKDIEFGTDIRQLKTASLHLLCLRGNARVVLSKYAEARSDFRQAMSLAKKLDVKELLKRSQGMYYWASGVEGYASGRYEKAEADLESAMLSFRKASGSSYKRATEFLVKNIEVDRGIRRLAHSENIESLKTAAEDTFAKLDDLKRVFGTIIRKVPRDLSNAIQAKHIIIRLLVDVLNGKSLDEVAFIDASESFEKFLKGEWSRRFEGIGILLRKLAKYENFKKMKVAEHDILGLTPDLSVIDGYISGQAISRTPWPLEMMELLKQIRLEVIGVQRQLIDPSKPETKQIKITFTATEITVDVEGKEHKERKSLKRRELLRLAEYIVFKKRVHWIWAYVIIDKFNPSKPTGQFATNVSTAKGILEPHGICIARSTKGADCFGEFNGVEDTVVSKINDVRDIYKKACSEQAKGDIQEAIRIISQITGEGYNWYTFTDAYMKLAEWIREENFKGKKITSELKECCKEFLRWYRGKLDRGLERIDAYIKKIRRGEAPPLSTEAQKELDKIEKEHEHAKSLHVAFINQLGFSAYDKLREELRKLQKYCWMVKEQAKEEDVYDRKSMTVEKKAEISEVQYFAKIITAVKRSCERCETVRNIIEKGFDDLDELLDRPKGRRSKYTPEEIGDMREGVYWKFGEVVDKIESFSKFDETPGSKFADLDYHLRNRLRKKLEKDMNVIKTKAWRERR